MRKLLLLALAGLSVSGCSSSEEDKAKAPQGPATVHEMMTERIDPDADAVWAIGNHAVDDFDSIDPAKMSDQNWLDLESKSRSMEVHARQLAKLDPLIAVKPGVKIVDEDEDWSPSGSEVQAHLTADNDGFRALAETLANHMHEIAGAAKMHDPKVAVRLIGELDQVCESCHLEFWYPDQKAILLGGVPGVMPGKVAVIGGGVVGLNAAQMAVGLGADVTILDRDPEVLERLATHFEGRAKTRFSNAANLAASIAESDLVIGGVLIPGAAAPKLVTRGMLATMRPGAVLVDVAIDQGGCFETSHATTHAAPTYVVDGIVHYCVANMPGAVARTSTYALNNVTLPYALRIANMGWKAALAADPHLAEGLNIHAGKVTYEAVARELGYEYTPVAHVLN